MGFAASQARLLMLVSRSNDLDLEEKEIEKHLQSIYLLLRQLLLLWLKLIVKRLLKLDLWSLWKNLYHLSSRISSLIKAKSLLLVHLSKIKKQKLAIKEEIVAVRKILHNSISNSFLLQETGLEQRKKKKIKPKEPLIRVTVYVLPEDVITVLSGLHQRMEKEKKPLWYIQLRLIQETLELLFAIYIQMKLENLWLFIKENLENLWEKDDETEED